MINLDACLEALKTVYTDVAYVRSKCSQNNELINALIYDLTTLSEVIESMKEMVDFNEKMNEPEGVTIDLTNAEKDYKDECERLSAILEDVTDEKDRIEKELFETQLDLKNSRHKIAMVKGVVHAVETILSPDSKS